MSINFQQGAPPGQSANDVLAYRGDAAMAGGFDSTGLPAGTGADSQASVDSVLKQINQLQFENNAMTYKQAIIDRDKSLQVLSDPSMALADILDKDRPELETKRQAILDAWKKNPNITANADDYLDLQNKINDFKSAAISSKSRNVEYKRQILAAAGESNLDTRDQILQNLHKGVEAGVLKQIDPPFLNPTFDDSFITADVPMELVGSPKFEMNPDGTAKVTTTKQTPIAAYTIPVSSLIANNGKELQNLQTGYKAFAQTPSASDEAFLRGVNTSVDKFNTDNKLNQNDPNFKKPIATPGADGTLQLTNSPKEWAEAMKVFKSYKRVTGEDLSKEFQKQKLDYAKNKSELADNYAQADYYKALAYKARKEGDNVGAETAKEDIQMVSPVNDALKAFDDALHATNYKPIASLPSTFVDNIQQTLTENGYDKNAEIAVLPKDEKYTKMLSEPNFDAKGKQIGIKKVRNVYAVRSDKNDISKVTLFGFDSNDKLIRSIDLPNGVDEIVKYNQGYKVDDKIQKRIESARRVLGNVMKNRGAAGASNIPDGVKEAPDAIPEPIRKLGNVETIKNINNTNYFKVGGKWHDADGNELIAK